MKDKLITITVDVDGNSVTREYNYPELSKGDDVWGSRVLDMLDTIEKSDVKEF